MKSDRDSWQKFSTSHKGVEWKTKAPTSLPSLYPFSRIMLYEQFLVYQSRYFLLLRQSYLRICIIPFKKPHKLDFTTLHFCPCPSPTERYRVPAISGWEGLAVEGEWPIPPVRWTRAMTFNGLLLRQDIWEFMQQELSFLLPHTFLEGLVSSEWGLSEKSSQSGGRCVQGTEQIAIIWCLQAS